MCALTAVVHAVEEKRTKCGTLCQQGKGRGGSWKREPREREREKGFDIYSETRINDSSVVFGLRSLDNPNDCVKDKDKNFVSKCW